jgi:hypothetical protein
MSNFSPTSWWEQVIFWWNDYDDVHFVLNQHAEMDNHSTSSLYQQFAGRHIAPPWNITLISSQQVFDLIFLLIIFKPQKTFNKIKTILKKYHSIFFERESFGKGGWIFLLIIFKSQKTFNKIKTILQKYHSIFFERESFRRGGEVESFF